MVDVPGTLPSTFLPEIDKSSLETIKSWFKSSIDQSVSSFQSEVNMLVESLLSDARETLKNPEYANEIYTRVPSQFTVGVGDSETGIYGRFSRSINTIVERTSKAINDYIGGISFTSQSQVDSVSSQVDSFSSFISKYIEDASKTSSDHLSVKSDYFSTTLNSIIDHAAEQYSKHLLESCLSGINRATETAIGSLDRLLSILKEYKSLPDGIYDNTDTILSDIFDVYNESINKSVSNYDSLISAYDYHTATSQAIITSGNIKIEQAITSSSQLINKRVSDVGEILKSISPYVELLVIDYIVVSKVFQKIDELFVETIRVRNDLDRIIKDVSSDAEVVRKSLYRHFDANYKPVYVYGDKYESEKRRVLSDSYSILETGVNSIRTEFSTYVSPIATNIQTYSDELQTAVIDYIKEKIPLIPVEQTELIASRFNKASSRSITRVSSYIGSSSRYVDYITDSIIKHHDRLVKRYYEFPPLIRYTGAFDSPSRLSAVDDTSFSFDVENIGGSPWFGWFGVRVVSASSQEDVEDADIDYTPPYFIWNKRIGILSIPPGGKYHATVVVPGSQVFNIKKITEAGSHVKWNSIINTIGVRLPWLKT